ncbi:MAG TPA: PAS domain-containing sensor histidine kinase, partial [Longimicrobium sp.]|nr:PAS domain-containing sensor histidine kinase [Longimicrobium sp.]
MPARRRNPSLAAAAPVLPGADELYRLLVENVTDYAILMLSPDGRVVTWTEGAGRMTGFAEEEVIGRPVSIFYPPEDAEAGAPERDLGIAMAQGRCEAVAWRVRRDGSRMWASVVLTAVRDDEGRMVGFGQIMRDLTERKEVARRYEESRQRYRSLFENNPDAICSFDLSGNLRTANPAAEALTGYAVDELLSSTFWELVVAADRERARALFARAAEGEPQLLETALTHCTGRRVEIAVRLFPIVVDGKILGAYCIAEDVTERKHAEAERETLLHRERIARAGAEAANAAKSDFLALMSHELKTPLNVISGFADLLADGEAGPLADAQRKPLDRIRHNARALLEMIEVILDYARAEEGGAPAALETVELNELLGEAAAQVRPAAGERGVALVVERDGACVAATDRARLRQVLANVLGNAVKFTERGEVRAAARRDGGA